MTSPARRAASVSFSRPARGARSGASRALTTFSVALALAFATVGCGKHEETAKVAAAPTDAEIFHEVTADRHLPPSTKGWPPGTFATPEVTNGGVAFLDYDNDGRLDIFQVCHGPPGHLDEPTVSRLFHQEADGTFKEVPDAGGLANRACGIGVAVGDYDGDGFVDVYVTNFGHDHLYHNNGDGTFTDVTAKAGIDTAHTYWGSSATWVDYNRDGHLDLFVGHFAEFDANRECPGDDGKRDYCGPSQFKGTGCVLYHNNGDGTFTDVTKKAGITYPGRTWGVIAADLTDEGWPDLYAANDEEQQNFYVNRHDGTFVDESIERGVAFSGLGRPEAGMGVAVGDAFNDGRMCLFLTHFRNEKNTLYAPEKGGTFRDDSAAAGMAAIDLPYTGWGCGFVDLDNDGNLDVALVNGRVSRAAPDPRAAGLGPFWSAYAEPNLLFRGDGKGRFTPVSARSGGGFTEHVESTRGLALGDIDDDGRVDAVTNAVDNTLRLYRNIYPSSGNHWITVRALVGKRDALGARVVVRAGPKQWTRIVQSGYSFASSNDPRAHVGLGKVDRVDAIEVHWPSGVPERERFEVPGVDRVVTVRQGGGSALASPATKPG